MNSAPATPTTAPSGAPPPTPPPAAADRPGSSRLRSLGRWVLVVGGALAVYAVFLAVMGASPVVVLQAMVRSAAGDPAALGETLLRATPILLAALAVAVPARAGQFNIGGEGQLLIGAIAAVGVARLLGEAVPAAVSLPLMALAAVLAAGAWALIAATLKVAAATNEAITTLLLNYVAALLLTWLVFGPWKDPTSLGQAYSPELAASQRLPIVFGTRVHIGVVVAVLVAVAVWAVLRSTSWGFQLRVVGGNAEAGRRAGLRVGELQVGALLVGGALAGLGGMIEVAGVEARLRPDLLVGIGFIGFLASWLARHHPLKAIPAALVLGAIAVGGNGLKLASGLSGSAVNILMAVLLLAVLGWAPRKEA